MLYIAEEKMTATTKMKKKSKTRWKNEKKNAARALVCSFLILI
jgi:hypothetical protein